MTPAGVRDWAHRPSLEIVLAALAAVVFLGFLGSQDLWGKREQRSAAETIDTLNAGHWLVAQIQGRPRLEKPPLPRWTIATLMMVTGRRDEWIVRLPSALSALGMVALVYLLGRRMAGRAVGLASGLALTSCVFFIVELRQAGNDGPLAFFTTLAVYAAWRRLHGEPPGTEVVAPGDRPGRRAWSMLFYAALGLGFLTKGPIIIIVVALAIIPYLAVAWRLRPGGRLLVDGGGLALFTLLALSWPVPVLLHDPTSVRVWLLEMGQKAGTAGITHHQERDLLALQWFWITAPWSAIATWAALHPLLRRGRGFPAPVWLAWSWGVVNLVMLCSWKVAKPNYFLPCLPGVALLIGEEWVRLSRLAREAGRAAARARRFLRANAAALLVVAAGFPVVVGRAEPAYLGWSIALSVLVVAGVLGGAVLWNRGGDVSAIVPPVAALAASVLIAFGAVAPRENPSRSHRALARTLDRILPPEIHTVMFFHELDEGLWFYLKGRRLRAVPGSTPAYNDGFDLLQEARRRRGNLPDVRTWARERLNQQKTLLLDWMSRGDRESPFVLVRGRLYDQVAADLATRARVVYRERDVKRNDVVLLRVCDGPIAAKPDPPATRR
jgi:4-amino-4-deoxy-L-arabinose transferase-like glycosyltransferase